MSARSFAPGTNPTSRRHAKGREPEKFPVDTCEPATRTRESTAPFVGGACARDDHHDFIRRTAFDAVAQPADANVVHAERHVRHDVTGSARGNDQPREVRQTRRRARFQHPLRVVADPRECDGRSGDIGGEMRGLRRGGGGLRGK